MQIAAPREVARWTGLPPNETYLTLLRAIGTRELVAGAGILLRRRPAGWFGSRILGDVMDLGVLAMAASSGRANPNRLAQAAAAVGGILLVDVLIAAGLRRAGKADRGIQVTRSVTVQRSPDDIYRFWRNVENLPTFMGHLQSVRAIDGRRSHWEAAAPLGKKVAWDAEITEDRPNELIAWRSLKGARVENAGSVRFQRAPGGRGTEIIVTLRYDPPGGKVGQAFAKLFGEDPSQQVAGDLSRLKQVLETGEVVRSEAALANNFLPQRPAQPPDQRTWAELNGA